MTSISYGVSDISRYTGTVGHGYISVNLNTGSFEIHGGPLPEATPATMVGSIFNDQIGVGVHEEGIAKAVLHKFREGFIL